jgi:hypothetical protein
MQDMQDYVAYLKQLQADEAFMQAELERMRAIAQDQAWRQREEKWV